MRSSILFLGILLTLSGTTLTVGTTGPVSHLRTVTIKPIISPSQETFDLRSFGAVGDGIANDGPALQSALNAVADAGGGTLFVPAGRYAIITPVLKNFSGSVTSLTILGVPSSTPVNTQGNGLELTRGLDLTSEFVIRTGIGTTALTLIGLDNLLISEMVFIGTPAASTDALITLGIYGAANAAIQHCEFYGLSTMLTGGAVVHAHNSRLTINQTVFLGCTGNSGVRTPVVLSTTWKSLSVTETIFADYGQRPGFFSKTGLAAAYSWIMIGNTASASNLSPRREAIIRNVFLDEGGFFGIAAIPNFYHPQSADSDLIYISDLRMNVSNLRASGIFLTRSRRVLVERAKFEWSQIPAVAVNLFDIGEAILDRLQCLASANRIHANSGTGSLKVINSICTHVDSQAQITEVITTETEEEDPVQYVRQQYLSILGHEPDGAAHLYWSAKLLACGADEGCISAKRLELSNYLGSDPSPLFAIAGRVLDQNGLGLPSVTVNLTGSQNVSAQTDAEGNFRFQELPTSGAYVLRPVRVNYTFPLSESSVTTPSGNRVANFTAIVNNYSIAGRVSDSTGQANNGATITLSGSKAATATTSASGNYSFTVPAEGNYTVSTAKVHYVFVPTSKSFSNLSGNQIADFTGTLNRHAITGQITGANGNTLAGVTVSLSGDHVATAITSSTGTYTFSNLVAGGNYRLTAAKQNYVFSPPSQVLNDLGANQVANFTGALVNYSIAGRVFNAAGQGISGATVTLSGAQPATTTTNASGNYSFVAKAEGSYTVSVAKVHYLFSPPSVSLSNLSGNQIANFTGALNQHAISGLVTSSDGNAVAGVSLSLSGSQSPLAVTGGDGRFSFTLSAGGNYTVVPTKTNYLFTPVSATFTDLDSSRVADFTATLVRTVEFSAASYQIVEGEISLLITVIRNGDTSGPATATYATSDDSGINSCRTNHTEEASSGCDYITSIGRVHFAPGETAKTFSIPIIDDGYAEGSESFEVTLSNLVGVTMGSRGSAGVSITDNETVDGVNPIESAGSFVRQNYLDFLNREPDPAGLAFWTNQITSCGSDAVCVDLKRANASAAFFLSTEFRETGYLVYRMYKAAYDTLPGTPVPLRFGEFLPDTRQIGLGVVVGETGWEELLENNKQAFASDFVARPRFTNAYPATLTPTQFVDALFTNAGVTPSAEERTMVINEFGTADTSADMAARGSALRRVAENQNLAQQEFNKAFVLIQYFGYLRRNPNDAPEATLDFQGYNFWLGKLNQFNGNFVDADMVKAFIISSEYRQRFGP